MEILQRDELKRGGFAGLRETRLVMDRRLFDGRAEIGTWDGIGNFVYLADARFLPKGETRLHDHKEIDVISVMVEGRIAHEGSLEHGQTMDSHHVQGQRAGGEGFSHNEINPDDTENRMIQLWVLPERAGEPAGFKLYSPKQGEMTRVYGGSTNQDETLDSHTLIDVGLLAAGNKVTIDGLFLAYVTRGSGRINDKTVGDGDLIRGENLEFNAIEPTQLIVVHIDQSN
ncbi:MAG: pirin family protein [Gammaproteobacteria bacterium]|nr:pirin family protein [Gammaproteobacteria bacterium]